MTASKELHDRIDRLPPEGIKAVLELVEHQEQVQRHLEALRVFQEGWTPEEQAAWVEGTERRSWRTATSEGES